MPSSSPLVHSFGALRAHTANEVQLERKFGRRSHLRTPTSAKGAQIWGTAALFWIILLLSGCVGSKGSPAATTTQPASTAVTVSTSSPSNGATLASSSVPYGALLTAVLTGQVLVAIYEWTHFLIHTAYRPRSRYYRSIWRNHRLHHFKNEHFWHGITNTLGDRALGTYKDQREVRRSETARTLQPD